MKNIIILENIRSAYNVGNIIRTADALGRDVLLSGYTPNPETDEKVRKTSLGAEENVDLRHFWHCSEALEYAKKEGYIVYAGEKCEGSIDVRSCITEDQEIATSFVASLTDSEGQLSSRNDDTSGDIALVMGNEKTGVLQETLDVCERILHIPMQGMKESLNVGQAAAILMWELGKFG